MDDGRMQGQVGGRDRRGSLMIYAPVPLFRAADGGWLMEDQACNGLRLWAENFDRLIAVMPVDESGRPPASWVPISRVGPALERIEIVPVPQRWTLLPFLRALPEQRRRLRDAMTRADRLGFAIGGLVGDWGAVAAWEAHKAGRPFYVWTDRVESEVTRFAGQSAPGFKQRIKARATWRPMAWLEKALVRRAALGLFHGRETYDYYAPYSPNPHMVHDIHLRRADHLAPADLPRKQDAAARGPLRVVYVGRADAMKGARDWLEVLIAARRQGVDIEAEWLGTGPELDLLRARLESEPDIAPHIRLRGMVKEREAVFEAMRRAQVFLFCHKTPESPRCLIEALASATPIVGYDGAFARDLIAEHGGGALVPMGDQAALVAQLARLASDRAGLAGLIGAAAADGAAFVDEAVFRHRSDIIIDQLPLAR